MCNIIDEYATHNPAYISVADAAILLKVSPSTVIKRIEKGTLPAVIPDDMPFTYDGKRNYLILLNALPQRLQYRYLYSRLPETDVCSVDLVSPRSVIGKAWQDHIIDVGELIKEATEIRKGYRGTGQVTEQLKNLASKQGISLASLYRFLGKKPSLSMAVLYSDPASLQTRIPSSMCQLSCDLAFALFLDKDRHYSQNDILSVLMKQRDRVRCVNCPYYPTSEKANRSIENPVCQKFSDYMVIPNHRKTINRLLSQVPPQMALYAKKGYREWRAKYGLFVKRERPLLCNELWIGDHHKCDLFVRITIKKEIGGRVYEKEIPVRPTLTAWMDSASSCIVGWVISVTPNSDTIAEAFCRAAVLTPDTEFKGLPKSILVDCGKDYRSKLLEDTPAEFSDLISEDSFLNKRFGGMGLLDTLGVKVCHALPYHPQSKPIERCFGTLEEKWISKLPGCCGSKPSERPADFQKRLEDDLKSKRLMTLEEFAAYFQNTILAEYHNSEDTETVIPDLPGWDLSKESLSPLAKYRLLEKARTVTPDWPTISILKLHYSPGHIVGRWGIRFCNTYYQADELGYIGSERVDILYHRVQPPYAPSSISVIHKGRFLCEAYPAEARQMLGDSVVDIRADTDRQNSPARTMSKTLSRLHRTSNAILPDHATGVRDEMVFLYDHTFAPSVIDETKSVKNATNKEESESQIRKSLNFLFGDDR